MTAAAIEADLGTMTTLYEATPEAIVRWFRQWEAATQEHHGPEAALDPPTTEDAAARLPRLAELRAWHAAPGSTYHGRRVGPDGVELAAMGTLWEEWRDDTCHRLGRKNVYQAIWPFPDEIYDGTARQPR
jgi:hypothetical protein